MLDSFFSPLVDFVAHVLWYRTGAFVLRAVSFGHLDRKFFEEYTYFTAFVGGVSIVGAVIVVVLLYNTVHIP